MCGVGLHRATYVLSKLVYHTRVLSELVILHRSVQYIHLYLAVLSMYVRRNGCITYVYSIACTVFSLSSSLDMHNKGYTHTHTYIHIYACMHARIHTHIHTNVIVMVYNEYENFDCDYSSATIIIFQVLFRIGAYMNAH